MLMIVMCGCQVENMTPENVERIDTAISITDEVGQAAIALGVIWPVLLPIGTLLLGGAAAGRKLKPKVIAAETNAQLYSAVTHDIIATIEDFKKSNPAEWLKLKKVLSDKLTPITKRIVNENK